MGRRQDDTAMVKKCRLHVFDHAEACRADMIVEKCLNNKRGFVTKVTWFKKTRCLLWQRGSRGDACQVRARVIDDAAWIGELQNNSCLSDTCLHNSDIHTCSVCVNVAPCVATPAAATSPRVANPSNGVVERRLCSV